MLRGFVPRRVWLAGRDNEGGGLEGPPTPRRSPRYMFEAAGRRSRMASARPGASAVDGTAAGGFRGAVGRGRGPVPADL